MEAATQNGKKINLITKLRLIERVQGFAIIASFYIMQIISSLLLYIILYLKADSQMGQKEYQSLVLRELFTSMLIVDTMFLIVLAIIYRKHLRRYVKYIYNNFIAIIVKIVAYYVLMLGITIVFAYIDQSLFSQYAQSAGENQELIESALTLTPSFAMIAAIAVVGPIVEEYVFRYGVISKLLAGVNRYLAAFISALFFSFIHIGFGQIDSLSYFLHLMISYMPAALVFGLIYAREQNLTYSIGLHMLNNSQAVLIIILGSLLT